MAGAKSAYPPEEVIAKIQEIKDSRKKGATRKALNKAAASLASA
jgi:hypothetical protein